MDELNKLKSDARDLYSRGLHREAGVLLSRAVNKDAQDTEAWSLLGICCAILGDLVKAEACFRKLVILSPASPSPLSNLGNTLRLLGKYEEAESCYKRAIALNPGYAEAYNNLGILYNELGQYDTAISHLSQALSIQPGYADAYTNLSVAYLETENYEEAIATSSKAIINNPGSADAHNNRANAYHKLGMIDRAISDLNTAATLNPYLHQAHHTLGGIHFWNGDISDAIHHYKAALRINGDLLDSNANFAYSLNCDPDSSPEDVYRQHLKYGHLLSQKHPERTLSKPVRKPDKTINIGYVSADFRNHPVSFFLKPLLEAHDRNKFTVFCYSNTETEDSETDILRDLSDQWRDIQGMDTQEACETIENDAIDVLVDLSGFTTGNRLDIFASRPAPVQISFLGYPNTTGLPSIEYRISDAYLDIAETTRHLRHEKLVHIDKIFACYAPPDNCPKVSGLPRLKKAKITFGSLHALPKLNDSVLELWREVLVQTPDSILLIYRYDFTGDSKKHLENRLVKAGLTTGMFRIIDESEGLSSYLEMYNQIDICLDTFPWSSHTTTCEALWMGVPVITLSGSTQASRMSSSVLSCIGLSELIATEKSAFIDIARSLSLDIPRLSALRQQLRSMMQQSPLFDYNGYTRSFENRLHEIWDAWCSEQPVASAHMESSTGPAATHFPDRSSNE